MRHNSFGFVSFASRYIVLHPPRIRTFSVSKTYFRWRKPRSCSSISIFQSSSALVSTHRPEVLHDLGGRASTSTVPCWSEKRFQRHLALFWHISNLLNLHASVLPVDGLAYVFKLVLNRGPDDVVHRSLDVQEIDVH